MNDKTKLRVAVLSAFVFLVLSAVLLSISLTAPKEKIYVPIVPHQEEPEEIDESALVENNLLPNNGQPEDLNFADLGKNDESWEVNHQEFEDQQLNDDFNVEKHKYKSLSNAVNSAQIKYDFYCDSDGSTVELSVDGNNSFIGFYSDLPVLQLQLALQVTPGTKHSNEQGQGEPDTNDFNVLNIDYQDNLDIPTKIPVANFQKGGGSPLWKGSTGNPYLYFRAKDGWRCAVGDSCASDTDVCGTISPEEDDSCETVYAGGDTKHTNPCVFRANHMFGKSPKSDAEDAPPRAREYNDVFVGRCSKFDGGYPEFSVTCCADEPAAQAVVAPTCRSIDHNILVGVDISMVTSHTIVASQISPSKFVECDSDDPCSTEVDDFTCKRGAGPHETDGGESCFSLPPAGVFFDKSSGNNKAQTDVPCNFENGANGTFTGCGIGGNPCINLFACILDGTEPCLGTDFDVLKELDCQGCKSRSNGFEYAMIGETPGCQCQDIQQAVKGVTEIPC